MFFPAYFWSTADMGKPRPAGQIRPAGPFILARRHLHKLKLPPWISGWPFFLLEIMGSSDFQQNKPQRCKIGIKNEVTSFYFGDRNRPWTVISKKKRSSPCFSISVRPAASTVFPNLDLPVKSLPTLVYSVELETPTSFEVAFRTVIEQFLHLQIFVYRQVRYMCDHFTLHFIY